MSLNLNIYFWMIYSKEEIINQTEGLINNIFYKSILF